MVTHKGTLYICTPRLQLRRFEISDSKDMYENWANDERVTRFLTWKPHKSHDETKVLLENWSTAYKSNEVYNWVMEYRGKAIGSISVVRLDSKHESADLGYCMGYDFWNKGLMTEAAGAVINFLFKEVGLNRIVIEHAVKNPASGKVAEKCGMTLEGTKRQAFLKNGEYHDINTWSILRSDLKK